MSSYVTTNSLHMRAGSRRPLKAINMTGPRGATILKRCAEAQAVGALLAAPTFALSPAQPVPTAEIQSADGSNVGAA